MARPRARPCPAILPPGHAQRGTPPRAPTSKINILLSSVRSNQESLAKNRRKRSVGYIHVHAVPCGARHCVGKLYAAKAVYAGRAGIAPVDQRLTESRHAHCMRVDGRILHATDFAAAKLQQHFTRGSTAREPFARNAAGGSVDNEVVV